jgi:hypothetical protein
MVDIWSTEKRPGPPPGLRPVFVLRFRIVVGLSMLHVDRRVQGTVPYADGLLKIEGRCCELSDHPLKRGGTSIRVR